MRGLRMTLSWNGRGTAVRSKAWNKSGLFWVCSEVKEVELEGGSLLAGYIPDTRFTVFSSSCF